MKKYIALGILALASAAYATQYIYDVIIAQGIVSTATIGVSGIGRGDAQIEFRNNGTGHAMLSSVLMQNPPNTVNENAWSGQAYGGDGTLVQQGAFYMKWHDPSEKNGYSTMGVHPNYFSNGIIYTDTAFEVYGAHGIAMFNGPSGTPPLERYLLVNRTGGVPSIVGSTDLVLESNYGGGANNVYLNAYNAGNVTMVLGGGNVGIGAYQVGAGAQYNIVMKNGNCPTYSPSGTGTLCMDSGGRLRFVGQNGTTTILAHP